MNEKLGSSNDGDGDTLESFIASDQDEIEKTTDRLALLGAVEGLDDMSKSIIRLRFFRELSQQQTAKILGLTQVKVSREEKKIFEKLRKQL